MTPDERSKMAFHELIVTRLGLSPFEPLIDHLIVKEAKAGRFHQSSCAIALYSNAYTQKAVFPPDHAPFGYINRRAGELFSFGVYRRRDGQLFGSILPLTANLQQIAEFTRDAMSVLPLRGIYVRFLRTPDYAQLVSKFGFAPAKEEPWLKDAPEEDESLSHSRVDLGRIFTSDGKDVEFSPLKRNLRRAANFLDRSRLTYSFVPITADNCHIAWDVIMNHFTMLEARGKLIGSTHHDYVGLLHPDILTLKTVTAYLGMLGKLPISVFISEPNGNNAISGYAGITLRDIDYRTGYHLPAGPKEREAILAPHGSGELLLGSSAIPTYAFIRLFAHFHEQGYRYFFMGGSEHPDIDTWKHRQMGAEKDPTYWAVYIRP